MNGTVPYAPVNDQCQYHYGMCAYSEKDVSRCPLCHVRWLVIDQSGYHSCEESNRLFAPSMRPLVAGIVREARERAVSAGV